MTGRTAVARAVTDTAWALTANGRSVITGLVATWESLYGAAAAEGATTVYVFDGASLTSAPEPAVTVDVVGDDTGHPYRWRVLPLGEEGGLPVTVVDVDRDSERAGGSPFEGLNAGELVDVLVQLERLLGVPWAASIGRTAERLILSTHPREAGGRRLDQAPKIPPPCEGNTLEAAWTSWRRPLTKAERGRRWVHVFDGNAQYLAAWGTAMLPHGVPVHHGPEAFDARIAGVWRFEGGLDSLPIPFAELFPEPWLLGRDWYTTPTVVRMLEVCVGMDIPTPVESWQWPASSRYLRGAAERLSAARKFAMDTLTAELTDTERSSDVEAAAAVRRRVLAGVTVEAVKRLYTVQSGRFGMARVDGSPWARPDWGHFIRATARVNLHRRLTSYSAAPFAIATDALAYASDDRSPHVAASRLGLTIGTGLRGEFKHAGTCPLAELADRLEPRGGIDEARAPVVMQAIR